MNPLGQYIPIILLVGIFTTSNMEKIYTFSSQTNLKEWRVVNDGVMGGVSKGSLAVTNSGHGLFSGKVSLANNGGFTSIQLNKRIQLKEDVQFVVMRIKGDTKRYQFRMKSEISQKESYVQQFSTSGEWEVLKLAIGEFYPSFRGRKLNIPNFNFVSIEQMSFLIANGHEEDFELLIDWIGVE